jgi:hypothetical protein
MTQNPTENKPEQLPSGDPQWTLLIYQAGDNNLSEECVYSLKEMKRVGAWDRHTKHVAGQTCDTEVRLVNVVVQFDPAGRGNPTRRFRIRGAGGDGSLSDDELIGYRRREADTSDPETLLRFLCESIERYRTQYYMVVLAGHGAGTREGFFLQDDERLLSSIPNAFPIPMLKEVFKSRRLKDALGDKTINILGFDACAMSMVEICYELRETDTLDLVVASEGFTINSGWPFDRIIEKTKEERRHNRDFPPNSLANYIVGEYINYYFDYHLGGTSIDQAVIDLSRIEYLKGTIDDLANTLIFEFEREAHEYHSKDEAKQESLEEHDEREQAESDNRADDGEKSDSDHDGHRNKRYRIPYFYYDEYGRPFQDAILLAHWAAQSYNGEQCVDLYDFCDLLQKRYPGQEDSNGNSVWYACQRVKEALRGAHRPAIDKSCYSGSAFQYSFGASLYFPWAEYDFAASYTLLDFGRWSAWTRFLRLYLKATKRLPRFPYEMKKKIKLLTDRFTPPTDRGPSGKVFSMRNPPNVFFPDPCGYVKQHEHSKESHVTTVAVDTESRRDVE